MPRKRDKMPKRNKKNFRPTKKGAGMTKAGIKAYRRKNPGSKLKGAVTGNVKKGSKAAKRRKSYCARSAGQMKKFPKAAKNPNSRLRQARRMLENIVGVIICIGAGAFAYVSSHMVEEKRQGKRIAFPWEKE